MGFPLELVEVSELDLALFGVLTRSYAFKRRV